MRYNRYITFFIIGVFATSIKCYAAPELDPRETARALSKAFVKASQVIMPSVVSISVVNEGENNSPTPSSTPLLMTPLHPQEEPFKAQGIGTGVIVDFEGHIITNYHVVGSASELKVRVVDGSVFEAKVVASDPPNDLALVQISAKRISPARLGNSNDLEIGEWVVAAGSPFGLENSITAGIVSAKGRSLMGSSATGDFIQTDAAINPGNSGGPLINLDGQVVGINSAIFSRSGGFMGIGFAIPINRVKEFIAANVKAEPDASEGEREVELK